MRMTVFQSSGVYPAPVRAVRAWQLLHCASTSAFPLASSMSFWAQAGSTEQIRAAAMKRYKWISIVSPRLRRESFLHNAPPAVSCKVERLEGDRQCLRDGLFLQRSP